MALLAPRPAHDLLLYNPSPSIPPGFYVRVEETPRRADIVTVHAADVAPAEALARDFTGHGDRFIKHVAAAEGDRVCAAERTVSINGRTAAVRVLTDSQGRPLPRWYGCVTLAGDQFLLLGDAAQSFDGRYWGPVRRSQIEGVWRRL